MKILICEKMKTDKKRKSEVLFHDMRVAVMLKKARGTGYMRSNPGRNGTLKAVPGHGTILRSCSTNALHTHAPHATLLRAARCRVTPRTHAALHAGIKRVARVTRAFARARRTGGRACCLRCIRVSCWGFLRWVTAGRLVCGRRRRGTGRGFCPILEKKIKRRRKLQCRRFPVAVLAAA